MDTMEVITTFLIEGLSMSIRQRITDVKVREKLKTFRQKRKHLELETMYSNIFKDCKAEVDEDMELDYGIGDCSSDRPSVFDHDEIHEDIIESYPANETIGNTNNSLTNLNGNSNRRIPSFTSEEENNESPFVPFWTRAWFKYGVPTGLGVTASLIEIWRSVF